MIEPFTVPFMGQALAELALLAIICGPGQRLRVRPPPVLRLGRADPHRVSRRGHRVPGRRRRGIFAGALVAGIVTAAELRTKSVSRA
jgi:hypothetical protein